MNQPKKEKENNIGKGCFIYKKCSYTVFISMYLGNKYATNMPQKEPQTIKIPLTNTFFLQEQEVPFDLILFILVFM